MHPNNFADLEMDSDIFVRLNVDVFDTNIVSGFAILSSSLKH
jgi:hypothetical protein